MLARRIEPPSETRAAAEPGLSAARRAEGRWRTRGQVPTRNAAGQEVRWWERPAPRGDHALWQAVCRLQARRIARGMSVMALTRALEQAGRPIARETLSRVLNGKQATSQATVELLACLLDVDVRDLWESDRGDDDTIVPLNGQGSP